MSLSYRKPLCSFRCGASIAFVLSLGLLTAFGSTATPGRAGEPAAPRYHVTDLGFDAQGYHLDPRDINELGVVVGEQQRLSAIWTPDSPNGVTGTSTKFDPLSGSRSSLFAAINDQRVAVGEADVNAYLVGLFWENGAGTSLHSPPNDAGKAYDINNNGRIVGVSSGPGRSSEATFWDNGVPTQLAGLASGNQAISVNDNGVVVGWSVIPGGATSHAVKWTGPVPEDLQDTEIPGSYSGEAVAINNLDHIVGSAYVGAVGTPKRGYFWGDGGPVELGNLGLANADCHPDDINDSDQIVGHINNGGTHHPFLYENGAMVNLNTLIAPDAGFLLGQATGINNAGQIVCLASRGGAGGLITGVLLTPLDQIPADLAVTLTAAPSPALVGRSLTYSGTVKNNGPQGASETQAVFTLPSGVDLVSTNPSASQIGNQLFFALGPLADEQVANLEVVVTPTATGTLSARLQADSPETDPVASNNSAQRIISAINPSADVSATLTATPNPVQVGQNLTYTGKVKNGGPHSTSETQAVFTLPTGVDLVSTAPAASRVGNVLTFALGTLADEQVADLQVVVTPTAAGTLSAQLQGAAPENDPAPANNTATRNVTARTLSADVGVTGTATPSTVNVGQTVTYRFTVKNSGPDPATGVRLGQTMAEEGSDLRFQSIETTKGSTRRDGDNIFAEIGALAKNETALVTIVAVAVAPTEGPLTRPGIVVSTEADPNLNNNAASPAITIRALLRPNLFGHWDLLQVKKKGKGKKLKYLVSATAKITNDGNAGAAASKLRFFLSTDRTRSKDDVPLTVKVNDQELPVEIPVNALVAGASQTIPVTGIKVSKKDYVAKLKGKFLLGVVDFAATVAEANENDNVFPRKGDKANPL